MAGFNINTGSKSQKNSQGEDEEGDSSDPLEGFGQDKTCYHSMRAVGSCILGKYEMPEEAEAEATTEAKKPFGLFGQKTFKQVCSETQKQSQYGQSKNYGLISLIVKSPDNLTQEQFAS